MAKSATVRSRGHMNKLAGATTANSKNSGATSTGPVAAAVGVLGRNKLAVAAGLFVLGIGTVIVVGIPKPGASTPANSPAKVEPRSSGAFTVSESNYNFGKISMAAGKVTHRYRIANAGADPIVIRKIYTSCMCTTAALVKGVRKFEPFGMPGHGSIPTLNETLVPKEEAIIEVVFDPAAHGPAGVGPIERVVTVENSTERPLELAFAAVVTP